MPTTATYTRPFHLTTASPQYSAFGSSSSDLKLTRKKSSKPLIIKKTENLRPFAYFAYATNDSVEGIDDLGASDTESEDEDAGMNQVSKMHFFERIKALLEGLRPRFNYLRKLSATILHPSRRPSICSRWLLSSSPPPLAPLYHTSFTFCTSIFCHRFWHPSSGSQLLLIPQMTVPIFRPHNLLQTKRQQKMYHKSPWPNYLPEYWWSHRF